MKFSSAYARGSNYNEWKAKKREEEEKELEEEKLFHEYLDLQENITEAKVALDEVTTSTATTESHLVLHIDKIEQLEAKGEVTPQDFSELKLEWQSTLKEVGTVKESVKALYDAFEFLLPLAEVVKQMDIEELAQKTPYALVYQQKIATLERDFKDVKETARRAEKIALDVRMIIIGLTAGAFLIGFLFTYVFPLLPPAG